MLRFEYVGSGAWSAESQRYPDLYWRIRVLADGDFVMSGSDGELICGCRVLPTFTTYAAAVAWACRMESPIKSTHAPR